MEYVELEKKADRLINHEIRVYGRREKNHLEYVRLKRKGEISVNRKIDFQSITS